MLRVVCLLLLLPSPAFAWNGLGHKVVADIAWQQLDDATRERIVKTLHYHPRFEEDFAKRGDVDDDRWVFQQAATWPDLIRKNKEYDQPTWHYVDFPLFVGDKRAVSFNLATEPEGDVKEWNVIQATKHSLIVLQSNAAPDAKALAYCWLFHLVGDMHQPLHSTALVCERFPNGDRGGNEIPTVQGHNLHSLWDGLLGSRSQMNDVRREVAKLDIGKVDTTGDVSAWIAESHELAVSFVYSPEILAAVQQPGELQPINLPESYLKQAGEKARQHIVAAGMRLASLLKQ